MTEIKDLTVTGEPRPCTPLDGEPSFTLLARDPAAPHVVLIWAAVRSRFEQDSPKVFRAREIAKEMCQWKDDNPHVGPGIHRDDLTHPLAEDEARVSGHTKRLLALGSLSMQDLLRQIRDLMNVAGIFNVLIPAPLQERIERAANTLDAFEWFRHLKTRGLYAKVAEEVTLCTSEPLMEGAKLVVYVGEGGKFYARAADEFNDGRFQRTQPDPMTGKFPE